MEYEKLLHIAIFHPYEEVRLSTGELLIQSAEERGIYSLKLLSGNEDVHIKTRVQAGKIAVQKAVKDGKLGFIKSMIESDDVPKEVVDYTLSVLKNAVKKFISKSVRNRKWDAMEIWAADASLPEEMREEICGAIIDAYIKVGNAEELIEMSGNEDFPLKSRIHSGKIGVEIISSKGDLEWAVALSKSRDVPEEVRKFAENKLEDTAKNTVKNAVEQGGFFHLKRWIKKDLPENIKKMICEAMVIEMVSYGFYDYLIKLAGNEDFPHELRVYAGKIAVDNARKEGDLEQMIRISNSRDLPKEVNEYAKTKIEKCAADTIGEAMIKNNYSTIQKYARMKELPENVRIAFGTAIVEDKVCRSEAGSLLDISGDEDLPLSVRELAYQEALKIAQQNKDIYIVMKAIKSKDVPQSVVRESTEILRAIAEKIRSQQIDDSELQKIFERAKEAMAARAMFMASTLGIDKGIMLEPHPSFKRKDMQNTQEQNKKWPGKLIK